MSIARMPQKIAEAVVIAWLEVLKSSLLNENRNGIKRISPKTPKSIELYQIS
jgi:hypothetical protein